MWDELERTGTEIQGKEISIVTNKKQERLKINPY